MHDVLHIEYPIKNIKIHKTCVTNCVFINEINKDPKRTKVACEQFMQVFPHFLLGVHWCLVHEWLRRS